MDNYFGMDSFNREEDAVYCMNSVRTRGVGSQSADIAPVKYLSLDGLQTYHSMSQDQIKKLEERIVALEKRTSAVPFPFVTGRLKRADLNLVFGRG